MRDPSSDLPRGAVSLASLAPAALPAARKPAPVASLRDRLDRSLPRGNFDHSWQRDRVLARAGDFERRVRSLTGDPAAMRSLRTAMGGNFDPRAAIELHGVASHFGPETMQAHARDRNGRLQVYTQDSGGRWLSRPDLADKSRRGQIPSADPGRLTRRDATATFGIDLRPTYEQRRDRREVPRETEERSPGGYRDSLVFDQIRRDAAA